ncbi:MAG: hypothetical protein IME93_03245 [Proteobacteria bacterium]|nr:hypothetical protein [Pseudomonadota bacterium]
MSDIVDRLRTAKDGDGYWPPILAENAADEIESLQSENKRLREALEYYSDDNDYREECQLTEAVAQQALKGDINGR